MKGTLEAFGWQHVPKIVHSVCELQGQCKNPTPAPVTKHGIRPLKRTLGPVDKMTGQSEMQQNTEGSTYPRPPLHKHPESHQNDGNTASRAKTSPCLRATRGTKTTHVTGNLPIPHPKHNCRNRALQHNVQANFSEFWRSSLPIRAIRSCGIEALSHLAPHLEQLHMLALWGSLWGRLGFRF